MTLGVGIWMEIESALVRFGGTARDEAELRALVDLLPRTLDDVSARHRPMAQELGAEALYIVGRYERVVAWSQPCLGAGTSLWIGRALFDLDRPAAALPHFRLALQRPLPQETRAKIEEWILCCRIACEPDAIGVEDLQHLQANYEALGTNAPTPSDLRRAITRRSAWPSFPRDLVRAVQALFGLHTIASVYEAITMRVRW